MLIITKKWTKWSHLAETGLCFCLWCVSCESVRMQWGWEVGHCGNCDSFSYWQQALGASPGDRKRRWFSWTRSWR